MSPSPLGEKVPEGRMRGITDARSNPLSIRIYESSRPASSQFAGPDTTQGIIKLAILAVGGQGGGVVTNWIVDLAESQGWYAQATSVAGVAQRTGATIYYIEMVPDAGARTPILSLSPSAGDVDIVLAAELMEAGRAVQRGFVTPDRTILIASSHRALAVGEKEVPGNGILSSETRPGSGRAEQPSLSCRRSRDGRSRQRQRHLRQPLRRIGRLRRSALPKRGLRGDDPPLRQGRRGEPSRLCRRRRRRA